MATPSSVKSQASALVAFAELIQDKLADTLDLAQYQPLYDTLKTRLADLRLNQLSVHYQMSQDAQAELLVSVDSSNTARLGCSGFGKFGHQTPVLITRLFILRAGTKVKFYKSSTRARLCNFYDK